MKYADGSSATVDGGYLSVWGILHLTVLSEYFSSLYEIQQAEIDTSIGN